MEMSGNGRCPLVTVRGKIFCLDRKCWLRRRCLCRYEAMPGWAVPDLLVSMSEQEFRALYSRGAWDSPEARR